MNTEISKSIVSTFLLFLLLPGPALAQKAKGQEPNEKEPVVLDPVSRKGDGKAGDDKSSEDEEADDADESSDQDEQGSIKLEIKVPSKYRGWRLRIDEEEHELDREVVRSVTPDWYQRVDLIDPWGRIVATQRLIPDDDLLERLRPHPLRAGLFLGGGRHHGRGFDNALLSGALNESLIEVSYQRSPLGWFAQLAALNAVESHEGVESNYTATQVRAGASWEMAPFRGFMERVHVTLKGGGLFAWHSFELTDGVTSIKGKSTNPGAIAGADFLYPLERVWLGVKLHWTYQTIKVDPVGIDTSSVQHAVQIGGQYGF